MKNLQKGFIVPLLVAIIALLVIGGGVYIYQNKKVEAPAVVNTEVQTTQTQQQTNTQTPLVNTQTNNLSSLPNTTNWKTYSNTIYGFEVQYPSNGFLTGDGYRLASDINDYVVEIRIPSPQAFMIEITSQKNLADFSKSTITLAKQSGGTVKNITVGGVPAVEIFTKFAEGNEYRIVLFVKNGNGYYINLLGPGFEISEKMLETFKFTK